MKIKVGIAGLVLFVAVSAHAVTTKRFVLDDAASLSAGELEGTSVHSSGMVTVGVKTTRTQIADVPLAYSLARNSKGTFFVGTGTSGDIYKVEKGKAKRFAQTGQLMVSALAFDKKTLYAATLPNGLIFRVDKKGRALRHAKLPGTEHIWALVYDKKTKRLLAATGPNGKILAINGQGKVTEVFKANAAHVMSLAIDNKGAIYAGTSDDALLIKIDSGGASVLHDFDGNEITALSVRNGALAVVANEFASPPSVMRPPAKVGSPARVGGPAPRPRAGKGRVWHVGRDGRTEMLYARDDGHFTSVEFGDDKTLYVGSGREGRIFVVRTDGTHATWVDVDERQVLAIDLSAKPHAFVTGDAAAFYRVDPGAPDASTWTSKVLDAKFVSRWGRLNWRGTGKFVFQTRSGNTAEPDKNWSKWSSAYKKPGRVRSPVGRFVQVRAKFRGNTNDVLRAVELFYLPQNQRAIIRNVRLKKERSVGGQKPKGPRTRYTLTWDVDNPDADPLRYRLSFRQEGQSVWRDMFREDVVLTENKYEWETVGLPDSHYVVRVQASDEHANPEALTMKTSAQSEPIRIDNHPPHVEKLRVKRGKVTGRAVDQLGPIAELQWAVNGGSWRQVFPDDQLLDEPTEKFSISLRDLKRGTHLIAVRAVDAAKNVSSAEITAKVK